MFLKTLSLWTCSKDLLLNFYFLSLIQNIIIVPKSLDCAALPVCKAQYVSFLSSYDFFIFLYYRYGVLAIFSVDLDHHFHLLHPPPTTWTILLHLMFLFRFFSVSFIFWLLRKYNWKISLIKTFLYKNKINARTFIPPGSHTVSYSIKLKPNSITFTDSYDILHITHVTYDIKLKSDS